MKNRVLFFILFFVLICLPIFVKADDFLNEITLNTNKESLDLDGNYYKSDYISISNKEGINNYQVKVINGNSNYVIVDSKGNKKNNFNINEDFVVISNKEDIRKEEDIVLRIDAIKDNKNVYGMVKLHINYNKVTKEIMIKTMDSETNKMINGVTYLIYDDNNQLIKELTATNYYINITDLSYGEYRIIEKEAPIGYKKSDIEKRIIIDKNSPLINEIEFINDPLKSIDIRTLSSEDNSIIIGAKLVLLDSENNTISEITTNESQNIIDNLYYGTYTIMELSSPSGYKIIEEPITFTIDSNSKDNKIINIYHDPSYGVKIYKLDVKTMKPISGTNLEILNSSGEVIKSFISSNTYTIIDDLENGLYTLREVNGETNHSEVFEIADNQLTTIYFVNNLLNNPKTNYISIFAIASIILGIIGYLTIVLSKKRFN